MKQSLPFLAFALFANVVTYAGDFGLKTAKSEGSTIQLALNAGVSATLQWSNGVTESRDFDGGLFEITVKSDSVTVLSESTITSIYLPQNELISLNVKSLGGSLERLYCASNLLADLDLSQSTQLRTIDCQDNSLQTLDLRNCNVLEQLNCSQNKLSSIHFSSTPLLTTLLCAQNELNELDELVKMSQLKQLWCDENRLSQLDLSSSTALRGVVATSNQLTSLSLPTTNYLADLWVEDNELTSLDISNSPALVNVSVADNHLSQIRWNSLTSRTLANFYAQNNTLSINSMPTIYSTGGGYSVNATIMPQNPVQLPDTIIMGESYSLSNYLLRNGFEVTASATPTLINAQGETLVRNTDYTVSLQQYTFRTRQEGVILSASSSRYPGCTFSFTPFLVYPSATSVNDKLVDQLKISVINGGVELSSSVTLPVSIYSDSGLLVERYQLQGGTTSYFTLSKGIYLINQTKVAIP